MKYDCLLPCQNLMAETDEVRIENGEYVHYYYCKSGNVRMGIYEDPDNCLCDSIDKVCRQKCPALKGNQ